MLVVVQAFTGIAFLLVLTSERADTNFLWAAGGVFLLAALLCWLTFRPASLLKDAMSWVVSRHARPDHVEFNLARREAAIKRFGTNAPPTLDEVREQREGSTNNWVPSRVREKRLKE
jgi:hypothetical protein